MALGRPMPPLELSEDETQQPQTIPRPRSLPHSIVQKAQIVLAAATGISKVQLIVGRKTMPCSRTDRRLLNIYGSPLC